MKRLLDYNADTGVRQIYEGTDDGFQIHISQDVTPILEQNKRLQNDWKSKSERSKSDFWQVAEIPIGVQYEWLINHGLDIYNKDHWPGVRKMLNSSDYRYLKTADIII